MKLKNIIYLIVIMLLSYGLLQKSKTIFFQKALEKLETTHLSLQDSDSKKLEQRLKTETLQDKSWESVKDYTINTKKLVNKKNARHLFKLSYGTVENLAICLKKDFCGMTRRSERDTYFDKNKTPGHILLKRNLSIMLECLKFEPDLKEEIDWDSIWQLTYIVNEDIQALSVKLIHDFDDISNGPDYLLETIDHYKGNAKAIALSEFSKSASIDERISIVNLLQKSFAIDDPNTVISIVEKLKTMNLSNDEIMEASKNLCHYKENGISGSNWKMLKYDMGKLNINLDNVCAN